MKTVFIKTFCCLFCSLGASTAFAEFDSLKLKSPFGDTPKPEIKAPAMKQATIAVPRKPNLKIEFLGIVDVNGQRYFAFHDKSTKPESNFTISENEDNPYGYKIKSYDPEKKNVIINIDNWDYSLQIGEVVASTAEATPQSTKNTQNQNVSNYYGAYSGNGRAFSPYSSFWDDDDDDDDDL